MDVIRFGTYQPDVSDFQTSGAIYALNVVPRADGYGPFPSFSAYSGALPSACRGFFRAIKSDGSAAIFAATSNRIFLMDNSALTWTPVSKVTALTSITVASPAVFTLSAHGLANGDAIVLSTTGALPTGLTVGTVYYVINAATNTFQVSATSGGSAVNTSGTQSGTHSMTYVYSAIPSTDQWQFVQFNNFVIAVQINSAPQVYDLTSSAAFADLGGSPPQAKYIWVTNRFVFLGGISGQPYRIQWSGLNATTTWTSGTNSSDFQDFPDGGRVLGGAGGEYGIVFQETAKRRVTYAPGSAYIFQIERISEDRGLTCPYSIIRSGDKIFYFGSAGFEKIEPGIPPVSIGTERTNRTVLADVDQSNKQLFIGVSDPQANRVLWAYKSQNGASGLFDKVLVYNYALDQFSPLQISGEFMGSIAQPGITLEGLDTISSSIDALTTSLDSFVSASAPQIAMVNSSHVLGFFTGSNLEATMETPAMAGNSRVFVSQMVAVTDAESVYGSIGGRNKLGDTETFSTEVAMDSIGQISSRVSAKYARGRIRIPAGTSWTYATGVQPDFQEDGDR